MFEPGQANAALSQAWQALPAKAGRVTSLKERVSAVPTAARQTRLLPLRRVADHPPCSEGVRWLVMKEPVQVSQAQLDAFKAVMHHPNNRPVQPLNGRLVLQ